MPFFILLHLLVGYVYHGPYFFPGVQRWLTSMASYTKAQSLQSDSLSRSVPRKPRFHPSKLRPGFHRFFGTPPLGEQAMATGKKRPMVGEWKLMDLAGTKNGLEKWEVRRITKSRNYTIFFVIKICAVPLAVGRLRIFPLFVYPSEELFICGENRETGRGFLSCATPKRGPEHGINLTTPTFCNKKKYTKGRNSTRNALNFERYKEAGLIGLLIFGDKSMNKSGKTCDSRVQLIMNK